MRSSISVVIALGLLLALAAPALAQGPSSAEDFWRVDGSTSSMLSFSAIVAMYGSGDLAGSYTLDREAQLDNTALTRFDSLSAGAVMTYAGVSGATTGAPTSTFSSGGSNVGQIANEAAKDLTVLKKGKMYCLAGIGGHISGIIEPIKSAKRLVAIDGCSVHCAKKSLEHAGFNQDVHIVVNNLNIEKNYDFMMEIEEIDEVAKAVTDMLFGDNLGQKGQ